MYSRKSVAPRIEPWETPALTGFLRRLPIQNYSMQSFKAKYLTWNSVRLKIVKKTSMPNPVNRLTYIKCYSLSSPRPVKSPSNSITCNCQKIYSWSRRLKTVLKIRKKAISLGVQQSYYLQVLQWLY